MAAGGAAPGGGGGAGGGGGQPGGGGETDGREPPKQRDESAANLQHISEREPDDLNDDPSLHPTVGPLFVERSKSNIESECRGWVGVGSRLEARAGEDCVPFGWCGLNGTQLVGIASIEAGFIVSHTYIVISSVNMCVLYPPRTVLVFSKLAFFHLKCALLLHMYIVRL